MSGSIVKNKNGKVKVNMMKTWVLARLPFLYQWRIKQLQLMRTARDWRDSVTFASKAAIESLPHQQKRHKSLLRRQLGNIDPQLQENKIINLGLALPSVDGLLIRPGETFSFWQRVGKTTKKKGYREGLMLSQGEVTTGVGGGLCQLANMLFWLALHSPLQIAERHHHSFDVFPDAQRIVPFGSGTSVFYNYVDLRFYNSTPSTFQFRLTLTEEFLVGMLLCDGRSPYMYRIEERHHRFVQREGKTFRENELWRIVSEQGSGTWLYEERMLKNCSEVKYKRGDEG
jgi:vancomycin resistance protein VanW